jgi:hypothetical protein
VPEDDPRLPRLPAAALSPEARALAESQLPWSPALKDQLRLQASLLPPARPLPAAVEFTRQGLTEQRQAISALERVRAARLREIAAIELEIAGRRETERTLEEWLARADGTPDPPRATTPPAKTLAPASATPNAPAATSPAATVTPATQPAVEHSGRPLVRRFLDENPIPGASAARVRAAMGGHGDGSAPVPGSWTASEATRLGRKLYVPSESTIQRELNERQASVTKR